MIKVILGEQIQDCYEKTEKIENYASTNDGQSYYDCNSLPNGFLPKKVIIMLPNAKRNYC